MSGNRYLGIGYLATHPACDLARAALVCPLCNAFETRKPVEYDRHFLSHDPSQVDCEEWLSAATYERIGVKRGWFAGCEIRRCNRKAEDGPLCWKHERQRQLVVRAS